MPFHRPTLSELRAQTAQDVTASVGADTGLLRRAVLRVLADIQAAMAHLHYGYLDWIARQSVPFTCADEALEGWAALKGVTRKPATAAAGSVVVRGTAGTVIPAGTAMVRAADGLAYVSAAAAAIGAGGTASVPIVATEAGAAGNAAAGATMALSAAVAGVQSSAVAGVLTGGADVETDDALRSRMLAAYQVTAQGGAADDYVTWALEVPGVTRAWCSRNGAGVGTVIVYVMMDEVYADGFPVGAAGVAAAERRAAPATGDLLTVADHLWPLAPVTSLVYAVGPAPQPVAFRITGVSAGLRDAVRAALVEQMRQDASPGGTVTIESLWAAVRSTGATGFDIQTPVDDITAPAGHLLTVGAITWS